MRLRGLVARGPGTFFRCAAGQRGGPRLARLASHSKNSATVSSRVMLAPPRCNYLRR